MSRYSLSSGERVKCVGLTSTAKIGEILTVLVDSPASKTSFCAEGPNGRGIYSKEYFESTASVPVSRQGNSLASKVKDKMDTVEVPALMRPKYAKGSVNSHDHSEYSEGSKSLNRTPLHIPSNAEQVGSDIDDGEYVYKTIKYKK